MSIQRIKINSESGIVYSPYTGEPAFVDDDINVKDKSLAFVYLGDIGDYSFTADQYSELDTSPSDLVDGVDLIVEVDAGWNGINYVGYIQLK
jgi:hypothetical protein